MNESGFEVGSKWLLCELCNHRIPIPKSQRQSKVQLQHGIEPQGKLFIQTIGGRKKKDTMSEQDKELASYFDDSGVGISKVDELHSKWMMNTSSLNTNTTSPSSSSSKR